jgi:hypothetical protein
LSVRTNGTSYPNTSLIADEGRPVRLLRLDLRGLRHRIRDCRTAHGYVSTLTTLVSFNGTDGNFKTRGRPMINKYTNEAALDFHTGKDEVHHAQLAHLAAMGRSIFHQVGATEVAQPELTTLVKFNGANGMIPFAGLIADAHGDLFGTTLEGGANVTTNASYGFGTVFEIAKTAHGYASAPTALVSFNGTNGSILDGSLITDAHGDLFGTTQFGGSTWQGFEPQSGYGTVFEIAKTAHGYASTPTTLVNFNGTDGARPTSSLIADAHGDLFGTTQFGGSNDLGTIRDRQDRPRLRQHSHHPGQLQRIQW